MTSEGKSERTSENGWVSGLEQVHGRVGGGLACPLLLCHRLEGERVLCCVAHEHYIGTTNRDALSHRVEDALPPIV